MLEQASIELADVVVSPSRYVIDWMQAQGWRPPPDTRVIPHLTRFVATGEAQPRVDVAAGPVRRFAFFGRLEERKGIVPFIEGVNALPADLLERVDVDFIGRATPAWTPERVRELLSDHVRASFATELDQTEALERLAHPGTLAVMPSFAETYGNTVRECLDYGIPFRASTAAAIEELVAPEDRPRVLFQATARGMAAALQAAAADPDALRPVRPACDPGALGLLFNGFGTSALVRRSLLGDASAPTWPLLAGLAAGGAHIVSVPAPLVTRRARPATIERQPAEALLVAERFESAAPEATRSLARLAAGLAAR